MHDSRLDMMKLVHFRTLATNSDIQATNLSSFDMTLRNYMVTSNLMHINFHTRFTWRNTDRNAESKHIPDCASTCMQSPHLCKSRFVKERHITIDGIASEEFLRIQKPDSPCQTN